MAHYSVVVAVKTGRLVARATRDFLHAVPAAVLAVAPGDEVLWFCETGELRLAFEQSPFESETRELTIAQGTSSPSERIAGRDGRHRHVVRYTIRAVVGDEPPAEGMAHIIVETAVAASARLAGREEQVFNTREGEILGRAMGGVAMANHKLRLKKNGNKVECDYYDKDGTPGKPEAAFPYLIVKKGEFVEFEAPSDAAMVIAFGERGSPFQDGTMVLSVGKGATTTPPKKIKDPLATGFFGHKFTVVLLKDVTSDIASQDPQIIIDNEG